MGRSMFEASILNHRVNDILVLLHIIADQSFSNDVTCLAQYAESSGIVKQIATPVFLPSMVSSNSCRHTLRSS